MNPEIELLKLMAWCVALGLITGLPIGWIAARKRQPKRRFDHLSSPPL
jgi:ABC-type dipeptide/oligopeptide/nickel transport system permease component